MYLSSANGPYPVPLRSDGLEGLVDRRRRLERLLSVHQSYQHPYLPILDHLDQAEYGSDPATSSIHKVKDARPPWPGCMQDRKCMQITAGR